MLGRGRRRGGAGAEGVNVDDDLDTVITIKPLGDTPAVRAAATRAARSWSGGVPSRSDQAAKSGTRTRAW